MMIKIESLGTSTAKIVYSDDCQDILSLPVAKITALFKSSGLLLFRGFGVTHKQMKAFSEKFSSRFIRDKGRPLVDSSDGFVGLVDVGMHYLGPHCEHANSPFRPDAVWFCCAVPAAEGGETLFWDGVRVWEELSQELKQLFVSKKIRFFQKFPADNWKYFLGSGATTSDVKRMLDGFEGVSYVINEDQSISLTYVCSSVVKTKYGNQDAFANSLLSEYKNPDGVVTFADGSLIPDAVIYEVKEVMDRLTEKIPWQAGDLAMIDNSKFLHGRRAFNDNRRQIFSTLSYLNF